VTNIKLQILEYNYWEHFKLAKDLALILPINHWKRKMLEEELNKLLTEIHKIKNEDYGK